MLIKSPASKPHARPGWPNNLVILVRYFLQNEENISPESLEEFGEVREFRVIAEDFN